jgi:diacylglycerol kinase family enzyme
MLKTHSKIPLSVLSLGTANNLARTLGFDASAKAAIDELENGCLSEFDVGLARGPWGKRYFFEGAGAGLFADYLRAPMKGGQNKKSKAEELRRHVQALRRRLRNYPAQKWELELDGKDYSGRYLLWQAMNICSVGPVLTLAAGAKTNDGAFDFVGAREEDRATLMKFLDARLAGKQPKLPLSVHRFRHMCLRWKKSPLHFDDEVWPEKRKKKSGPRKIEVVVKKSALRIWKTEAKK